MRVVVWRGGVILADVNAHFTSFMRVLVRVRCAYMCTCVNIYDVISVWWIWL